MTTDIVVAKSDGVPKPDRVVPYAVTTYTSGEPKERGALYLYGDPSSEKIAICCAGFADDHTIFQSFAYELGKRGNAFVGVICLPGYDDRPEDGAPWTSHNKDGYSFNEWADSIDDAVTKLRDESTYDKGVSETKFTGIFHDWGVVAGAIYMSRALKDGKDGSFKPDNVVYFDILLGPSKDAKDVPKEGEYVVTNGSLKERVCQWLYRVVLAKAFWLQRYVSKYLAAMSFLGGFIPLELLGLGPLYKFDNDYNEEVYKKANKPRSLFRLMYMSYPYLKMFNDDPVLKGECTLHADWNKTPILYMYGTKKRTQFHDGKSLHMLQEASKETRNATKVIPVEDAGHFLYVQKPDICVDSVIQFMNHSKAMTMDLQ